MRPCLQGMQATLDTNRCTDFCRGEEAVVELLERVEAIFLPFVVLGELSAGFAVGRHGSENERVLRQFLWRDGVRMLFADDQTTHHYGAVYRQLRAQGTPIPTNDMWVAALVLQHNLVLCGRDRHLDHLRQITVV